jgi:hypothetical protein
VAASEIIQGRVAATMASILKPNHGKSMGVLGQTA